MITFRTITADETCDGVLYVEQREAVEECERLERIIEELKAEIENISERGAT